LSVLSIIIAQEWLTFSCAFALDNNGRYCIKQAGKFLSEGVGYFIYVNREYAGFVLLNNKTKSPGGVFISEFYILPCFRRGLFYKKVISCLFSELKGHVEFCILKKNRRALVLFEYLSKKYLSKVEITDECENEEKSFRFALDTENILIDLSGYRKHIMQLSKKPIDGIQRSITRQGLGDGDKEGQYERGNAI